MRVLQNFFNEGVASHGDFAQTIMTACAAQATTGQNFHAGPGCLTACGFNSRACCAFFFAAKITCDSTLTACTQPADGCRCLFEQLGLSRRRFQGAPWHPRKRQCDWRAAALSLNNNAVPKKMPTLKKWSCPADSLVRWLSGKKGRWREPGARALMGMAAGDSSPLCERRPLHQRVQRGSYLCVMGWVLRTRRMPVCSGCSSRSGCCRAGAFIILRRTRRSRHLPQR